MTKISQLAAAAGLEGAEVLPVVQDGETKKASVNQLFTFVEDEATRAENSATAAAASETAAANSATAAAASAAAAEASAAVAAAEATRARNYPPANVVDAINGIRGELNTITAPASYINRILTVGQNGNGQAVFPFVISSGQTFAAALSVLSGSFDLVEVRLFSGGISGSLVGTFSSTTSGNRVQASGTAPGNADTIVFRCRANAIVGGGVAGNFAAYVGVTDEPLVNALPVLVERETNRLRDLATRDAADAIAGLPGTLNIITASPAPATPPTYTGGVLSLVENGFAQVFFPFNVTSGQQWAAAFSMLSGNFERIRIVLRSGGISGSLVSSIEPRLMGSRIVASGVAPANADTIAFQVRANGIVGGGTFGNFDAYIGVSDEPPIYRTPAAVQASINASLGPSMMTSRFAVRSEALSKVTKPRLPRTIDQTRRMTRQERLRVRASMGLTGTGKTVWMSQNGSGDGLTSGAPANPTTAVAALQPNDTLKIVGNFSNFGMLTLPIPPIKIDGYQADGVTKARLDGRIFPTSAIELVSGTTFRFPLAERPGALCYDLKQDDAAGSVTGIAVNSPRRIMEMARTGVDPAKARAWYGWIAPSATDTATPASGLYSYSGGFVYVNLPGVTLADLQNGTTGLAYCPIVPAILNLTLAAGYDFQHGLHVDGLELYHNPTVRGAGTYALAARANMGLFENIDCAQNGYHSITLATGNDLTNTIHRCPTLGMAGDTSLLNGGQGSGRGTGGSLPYVFFRSNAADPFVRDAGHLGSDLFFLAYPQLGSSGAPIQPTAAYNPKLGFSHCSLGQWMGGVYWDGCVMFDCTADLDAKHGSTTNQTKSSGMTGFINAGERPPLADVDQFHEGFGPHFDFHTFNCRAYGPNAAAGCFVGNWGLQIIREREVLSGSTWTTVPVGFTTDLLQNNNQYTSDAFVAFHMDDESVLVAGICSRVFFTIDNKAHFKLGGYVNVNDTLKGTTTAPRPAIASVSSVATTGGIYLDGAKVFGALDSGTAMFSIPAPFPTSSLPTIIRSRGNNVFGESVVQYWHQAGSGAGLQFRGAAEWQAQAAGGQNDLVAFSGALPVAA